MKMGIRNGVYAKYKEREYGISTTNIDGSYMIDTCRLISGDKADMEQNGFNLYILPEYVTIKGKQYKFEDGGKPTGSYYKVVAPSEVDEVYGINTFGIYKGSEVGVRMDDKTGQNLLLGVGDEMLASKLGFEFDERGVYMKWLPKEEVELFEKKEPLPNYFK